MAFGWLVLQHWTDELGRKRYRVRRRINGKLKVLGELPANGDPSSLAYHALLRGEKISDAVRQGHRARRVGVDQVGD